MNHFDRAKILVEALPYIREFYAKIVVVKCGGEIIADEGIKKNISQDFVLMRFVGIRPVIVHGGGFQVTKALDKLGKKTEFTEGLRKTDEETIQIVEAAFNKINKDLVSLIKEAGGKAVGLSGKNDKLVIGRMIKSSKGEDLGMVGEVERINSSIIKAVDEEGFIPVIAPLGLTEEGVTLNINADSMAAEIAIALKAEKLIILTNKPGIMHRMTNEDSLISTISISQIDSLIEKGIIKGGMLPKVKACRKALDGGVHKTHIIDGRLPHSILLEIFTDKGIGTEIVKNDG